MSQWEMVKLGDVCDILDSMRIPITSTDRKSGIYPYYGANGIQDYIDEYIFDDELVLLAEDGGNFGSKSRPIAYRVSGKCWVNNHAHVLKPKEMLDVDYLCYSIMFYDVSKIISGTTRAKLNQAAMRKMSIPLPPIAIQQKIAKTLDTAANLLKLRKQQLAELDLLIQSVFYEMFGDPVRNEKGWEIYSFERIIDFMTSGSRGWAKYYSEQGEFFITIKNVKNGKLIKDNMQKILAPNNKEALRTRVQENDLLISITADLGRTAVVDKDTAQNGAFINQHLCLIRLDFKKIVPIFLAIFLESPGGQSQFQKKNQVGVKSGLNFEAIKSLRIPIPPLSLQAQFAATVEKIEQQKALVQQSIDETQTLFDSLMRRYFE
ncbi:MAG: restriction endonuclease subunit S [Firmicutes bacterium HGW-Firmicutes-4]|jgi:type I restriction enzyme S subunit|nr:MAG: restriction endonuclease subunit S [Firmicutes bacterium HGW-Firmicutes-4]